MDINLGWVLQDEAIDLMQRPIKKLFADKILSDILFFAHNCNQCKKIIILIIDESVYPSAFQILKNLSTSETKIILIHRFEKENRLVSVCDFVLNWNNFIKFP